MKILDARVRWNHGWSNKPQLEVLVDQWPKSDEFVYEKKMDVDRHGPCALYFGTGPDGSVRFFADSGTGDGYGGSTFVVKLTDGRTVSVKGPWSSREGVMNKFFPTSVGVIIYEVAWGRSCGLACHLTLERAQEAAKMAGVPLVENNKYLLGETYWLIPDELKVKDRARYPKNHRF